MEWSLTRAPEQYLVSWESCLGMNTSLSLPMPANSMPHIFASRGLTSRQVGVDLQHSSLMLSVFTWK